jgi:anti-sigma factor RsiW
VTEHHPPGEEIQDFADGRLTPARRATLAAHFAICPQCGRELERLRWVKEGTARLPLHEPPADLTARVAQALDGEDRRGSRASPLRRYLLPAAGVLAAAAAVVILVSRGPRDLPSAVARDFTEYGRAVFSLDTLSGDGPALERYFARRGLAFPTRVFDLGMMEYRLVGARVHRLEGRPSALFVYRGDDDRTLVCQMFEASLDELPQGGETREHSGIEFRILKDHGLTLVFWMEGSVVCVLVSDAPGEEVVHLAYAKAVKL